MLKVLVEDVVFSKIGSVEEIDLKEGKKVKKQVIQAEVLERRDDFGRILRSGMQLLLQKFIKDDGSGVVNERPGVFKCEIGFTANVVQPEKEGDFEKCFINANLVAFKRVSDLPS